MRIAIDIRLLQEGRRTGVEEYAINLLGRIFSNTRINADYTRTDAENFQQKSAFGQHKSAMFVSRASEYILLSSGKDFQHYSSNIEHKHLKISNRALNISLKIFSRPLLDKKAGGADIFWMPNINIAPVSGKCRKVITFHDLSFEYHPHFFSLKRQLWHKFINPRKEAHEANKIIAVSESTKQDLISIYEIEPEKVEVIYSGIGEQYKELTVNSKQLTVLKKKYKLPDKFILYLGTIEPRKNIIGIIKSFESLKKNYSLLATHYSPKLVIAGSSGWLYQDIYKAAHESKYRDDIIFTGFVEDEDKPLLYNLADLFIYPSFFEGFGFPPLEAMACGVPTIVSNSSSLPEAVGDAAIMVDPYNIDEITAAMEMLLTDEKLRNSLRNKGIERAKMFSWDKCAKETLDVLANLHK